MRQPQSENDFGQCGGIASTRLNRRYAEDQENVEERSGKKIADVLKIFPPLPQFSGKLDPTVHLEMLTEYFKQMVGSGKITKDEMFDFIKNDLATRAKNQ
ncbi:uncharacterized protein PHALS_12292 [Plasmopara halstedii]|uniref:Uncharacterized protein n=1 Tax=Plasmopara halstedii TaxID=4781 RepID=A0A0P1AMG8_PLAHL|nr:uncharacterized protein PHALS_12292 [Plasmopara halstedii]CEG41985.1 hypothetical protein PHALS_12292 [Plasmopara halstedii]|eukprot:XP_024578354.1 hypothetical protein PHALS_12292 [Plasmopara halstedii]